MRVLIHSVNSYIPTLVNRVAGAALKGASGEFAKRGLTVPKYRVLLTVAEYDNIHFRELAKLTSVERPTLSRLLDEMQRDGLLQRRRDPDDSRSINISLKGAGHTLLESTTEWALEVEKDILQGVSDAEANLLRRLLAQMFENLVARAGRLEKNGASRKILIQDRLGWQSLLESSFASMCVRTRRFPFRLPGSFHLP